MNLHFGGHVLVNVKIPLLWGKRAIIADASEKLSVIDLSSLKARPEIVADVPWHTVPFSELEDGYVVYDGSTRVYFYSPLRKLFRDLVGSLPECQIFHDAIRVGSNTMSGNVVTGASVGIGVSEDGFFIGGPLPAGLAELAV